MPRLGRRDVVKLSTFHPPSTLLIVGGLVRPELLVEIECLAVTS